MKIILAGNGFVGKAVAHTLQTNHYVLIVDPKYTKEQVVNHHDADGLIICVNTPTTDTGMCDVRNIIAVMDTVPVFMPVLIKSTVLPHMVAELEIMYPNHSMVFSPEFLRAATAVNDFAQQSHMIMGGEDPEGFWQELFSGVLPNCKLFFHCTAAEAVMVKYSINAFLSIKVSFFNQLFDMCEKNGTEYSLVRHMITQDNRIGAGHSLVGLDNERGYGGACFPKDTEAFLTYAKKINTSLSVLESSMNYNKTIRKNT